MRERVVASPALDLPGESGGELGPRPGQEPLGVAHNHASAHQPLHGGRVDGGGEPEGHVLEDVAHRPGATLGQRNAVHGQPAVALEAALTVASHADDVDLVAGVEQRGDLAPDPRVCAGTRRATNSDPTSIW